MINDTLELANIAHEIERSCIWWIFGPNEITEGLKEYKEFWD